MSPQSNKLIIMFHQTCTTEWWISMSQNPPPAVSLGLMPSSSPICMMSNACMCRNKAQEQCIQCFNSSPICPFAALLEGWPLMAFGSCLHVVCWLAQDLAVRRESISQVVAFMSRLDSFQFRHCSLISLLVCKNYMAQTTWQLNERNEKHLSGL